MSDPSLAQLFQKGELTFLDLQSSTLPSTSDEYQAQVTLAIGNFERSAALIRQLSLFSDNEFLEDISTKDLRYLLTEYYLGELFLKRVSKDRLDDLVKAKEHFDHFIHQCETHDILAAADKKYLEEIAAKAPKDAATRRGEKIARFKREKDMKQRIEEYHKTIGSIRGSGLEGELDPDLEDQYRDFVLLHLQFSIFQTTEQLVSIGQEKEMVEQLLERQKSQQHDSRAAGRSAQDQRDARVDDRRIYDAAGPLMDPQGRPLRPFVITNRRTELMKGVFRPGHNLPTMSIDEYLQQEHERGNVLSGGTEEPKKKEIDDNDEEAIDAQTYKDRAWDDFKDANPKGWGNKGGRHG
ncbi:hypothetical protein DFQ27_000577 [Actinomortierella ambigua]|uniref:TAP42-like protein n=1 Tax=Actinomortierella ambigua TaxID=1343610 RepID=A0A9P6U9J1_9FUNG|nr:hypothetical protein DFQ27_000577 [Actinomortierella ambigua]